MVKSAKSVKELQGFDKDHISASLEAKLERNILDLGDEFGQYITKKYICNDIIYLISNEKYKLAYEILEWYNEVKRLSGFLGNIKIWLYLYVYTRLYISKPGKQDEKYKEYVQLMNYIFINVSNSGYDIIHFREEQAGYRVKLWPHKSDKYIYMDIEKLNNILKISTIE